MSITVGIVGAGNISQTHLRAAESIPGVDVVAVLGTTREKAARLAESAGASPYDDLGRFLAHTPMDLVAIGTPSGVHAEQAIAAIERGLHVLVEKPVDISTARVDALIGAADRARVKVGVFFQDRLKPDVARLKSLMDSGALGAPILVSGRVKWHRPPEYYGDSRWRGTWALDGGGALMNQGIHTVDVLQWLAGPVARISARTATRLHKIEVEDTAAAVLEFASGALGVLEAATSVYPGYPRRVEVTGSEGTAILEGDTLVGLDLRSAPGSVSGVSTPTAAASTAVVADSSAHRRIFEDFIAAIGSSRAPACDAREGRKSVAIVEAIYTSAREGRTVVLKDEG
jgi:UDP-N-acetyl-2-amino-2-deoxyglucuronate dehydrogenase